MPNSPLLLPPLLLHLHPRWESMGGSFLNAYGRTASVDLSFFLSPSSCSHHVFRRRHGTSQKTSVANHVRQPHQLIDNQRHVHLIEISYCEDTKPGQQLEAAQRQHADLCKNTREKLSLYAQVEHTLNQFKQLGFDNQRAIKIAHELHAHSVMYAIKLVTARRAIRVTREKRPQSRPLWWRELTALLSQCVSFPLIDVGSVLTAYLRPAQADQPNDLAEAMYTFLCGWHSPAGRASAEQANYLAKDKTPLQPCQLTSARQMQLHKPFCY
eukprot:1160135-Pelagomonas_calceolata.AAC.9